MSDHLEISRVSPVKHFLKVRQILSVFEILEVVKVFLEVFNNLLIQVVVLCHVFLTV